MYSDFSFGTTKDKVIFPSCKCVEHVKSQLEVVDCTGVLSALAWFHQAN